MVSSLYVFHKKFEIHNVIQKKCVLMEPRKMYKLMIYIKFISIMDNFCNACNEGIYIFMKVPINNICPNQLQDEYSLETDS